MSRIGKAPVTVPEKVTVAIDGNKVTAKGPLGELTLNVHPRLSVKQDNGTLTIAIEKPDRRENTTALWGTNRALLANVMEGVSKGFTKQLEIVGVGYNAKVHGNTLVIAAGYSHPVEMEVPEGLKTEVKKNTITITGIDKEQLGIFAAKVRAARPPEPYKGKGIRYKGEHVRRKEGKKAVATEGGA